MRRLFSWCLLLLATATTAQPTAKVNVFLGSAGDHGQMSPAASYPFSMLSIGPQTYPASHMGYDHYAKKFLGFTHNRMEGVGCQGCGGNILVKPFLGGSPDTSLLLKRSELASPGNYSVLFTNGIHADLAVYKNAGIHQYSFPAGKKGLYLDLGYAFVGRFVGEEHTVNGNTISGWIESKTTCSEGTYRIYYHLESDQPLQWKETNTHQLIAEVNNNSVQLRVALSSVSTAHARSAISKKPFAQLKTASDQDWNTVLNRIRVKGDPEREKLFYSLFYRTVQSPYVVSEPDGAYRAIDGTLQQTKEKVYNGWAIWDNYRTQLPLLSLAFPEEYKHMANSIAGLYRHGKKDFATQHEPSITVRTEHAIVVLLDAYRKGYPVDLASIIELLEKEAKGLNYGSPDKALESCYDAWALSEIYRLLQKPAESEAWRQKAMEYRQYWTKDFQDLTRRDVDRMQARGLYQGTIWQYRWFVPFDVPGLIALCGGESAYISQLDEFFGNDYYNHANQPDLQAPFMYNMTSQPWKSQALVHKIAVDTMVQHYFNDNSRGIGSEIGPIYKNQPKAYIRTMDDDAGTMSSWFVLVSAGLFPACIGTPEYYLNVPLFESVEWQWGNGKKLTVKVKNFGKKNVYIREAKLNGKKLEGNLVTHEAVMNGGLLEITASDKND